MGVVVASLMAGLVAAAPVQGNTAQANPAAMRASSMASSTSTKHASVPQLRVPGIAIVKLKPTGKQVGVDVHALKDITGRTGVDLVLVRPTLPGWIIVEVKEAGSDVVPDEAQTLALIEQLAADEAVADAVDDKWMRSFAVANDLGRDQQWPLNFLNINQAWDRTQGLSSQRVGVVDTGLLRGHEDMAGKVAAGFDFISNGQTAQDGDGPNGGRDADFQDNGDQGGGRGTFHGTHVAGTIAAATNNGAGIAGINRNAQLVIVRALGLGGGDLVDIMEGAEWLAGGQIAGVPSVGANKVSVMNLSLGSDGGCSAFEQEAINRINAAGVIFVAAAGNSSQLPNFVAPVGSPASCSGVVAVAAHGQTGQLAPYSSFGNQIDIVAPGGDLANFGQPGGVLSTLGPGNGDYGFYEGTSMAAPHVAGVISLMQAIDPAMDRVKAESLLVSTGQACNGCGGKLAMDANAAVNAVVPGADPVDPVDPVTPGVDDDLEENDVPTAGQNLTCGTDLNLVALPADQDWFDVSVGPGSFSVSIEGGAPDLDLFLVKDGAEVARSAEANGNEAINANVQGSFILQILVDPFVDATNNIQHTGPYVLRLDCTPGAALDPDPVEPDPVDPDPIDPGTPAGDDDFEADGGDDPASALELFCAQSETGLTSTDDDWFFVDVRDGDTLQVGKSGADDVDVEIVDGAGVVLGNGAATAIARNLPGGKYLVHVPASATGVTYALDVACRAPNQPSGGPGAAGGCSSTSTTPSLLPALPLLGLLGLVTRRRRR